MIIHSSKILHTLELTRILCCSRQAANKNKKKRKKIETILRFVALG